MSDGGKGSTPRPFSNFGQFQQNFDRIFGKPSCFGSKPSPQQQAENCCNDCKHKPDCLEK